MAKLLQNPKLSIHAINYGSIGNELSLLNENLPIIQNLQFEFNNLIGGHIDRELYNSYSPIESDSTIIQSIEYIKTHLNEVTKFTEDLNIDDLNHTDHLLSSTSLLNISPQLSKANQIVKNLKDKLIYLVDKYKNMNWNEITNQRDILHSLLLEINDLSDFRYGISESLRDVTKKTTASLEEIKNELNNINKKNELFNEFIKRINEDKFSIINKLDKDIKNLKEEYENLFKNYNLDLQELQKSTATFNNSVENSLKNQRDLIQRIQKMELQFSEVINEKKQKIDEELEKKVALVDNQFNALRSRVNTKTKKIKDAQKDLMILLEKTSIHNLTDNYKIKAQDEKRDYKINSRITIGAIICAIFTTVIIIGLPIYEYWKHVPPIEPNYYSIVARLTVSLMFFVLAIYTSKQAAKHYECFQENNRTYLQLAALEPFMSRMSDEEQKAIRKGLIPVYFNQNEDGKFASKGDEVSWLDVKSYLEKISEFGKNNSNTNNNEPSKPTNG